jgi:leader peptidase (prepilin peptidase)/N-methyltransferase
MAFIIPFIFGLLFGSFLNVLIDRLPEGKDVIRGRSHCDHCKRILSWWELIPIVSWMLQRGESRCCHKKLSIQYPLIELITGIGFVLIVLFNFPLLYSISSLLLFCSFIVIFVVDLKTEYIPVQMFYVIGIGIGLRFLALHSTGVELLYTYSIPSLCAGLFFFLLWFFSKGRAMGDGDILLVFFIGLVIGYPKIIISLYVAFLTGAAVGVILILRGVRTMKSHIPFGPFLIFGMGVAMVYGELIMNWWSILWV